MYSGTCREAGHQLTDGRLPGAAVTGVASPGSLCEDRAALCAGEWLAVGLCPPASQGPAARGAWLRVTVWSGCQGAHRQATACW